VIEIAIDFPGRRYHATPWGRHVNEGAVEWPPSPWRLLRALLAVGFHKHGWTHPPDEARGLIEALAERPPRYLLPPTHHAHTRHYMPTDGTPPGKTKVLDAFLRFADEQPLRVRYDVELETAQRALLAELLGGLTYLGRAESWCEVELVEADESHIEPDGAWCVPADDPPDRGFEQVKLLSPTPAAEYADWREHRVEEALEQETAKRGKKLSKAQRTKVLDAYPAGLIGCLTTDTTFLQKHGWNQPPGSRWQLYHRPAAAASDAAVTTPARPRTRTTDQDDQPRAALLSLYSDTRRGDMLPLMVRCLPVMETVHRVLVAKLGDDAPDCPALSGRQANGKPLDGSHRHAHYLPLSLHRTGPERIDHVLIWAPGGLDPLARRAILSLRHIWAKGYEHDIFARCTGFGSLDLFHDQLTNSAGPSPGILTRTDRWGSATPFVPPQFVDGRSSRGVETQLRRELKRRGFPAPAEVEVMPQRQAARTGLLAFRRRRRPDKPQPPRDCAFGVRITFDEPVTGPIALGYASHFGMGLFRPEAHKTPATTPT
jgi:CRISPR-associated protein Csb2